VVDLPLGILTHSLPIALATNKVWLAALIGLGVIAMKVVNWSCAGDMCENVSELLTLVSTLASGLLTCVSVAPVKVVVNVNSSPQVAVFTVSLPLPDSVFSIFFFKWQFILMCPLFLHFQHSASVWSGLSVSEPFPLLCGFPNPEIAEIALYCITTALDRYIMLLDRTPHTWMMTSLNICGMVFYDHWHHHLHPSLFYFCPSILLPSDCFCLSRAPMDKTYLQLIPVKLGYHQWISQPQPDLWHLALWRRCGKYGGRDRQ